MLEAETYNRRIMLRHIPALGRVPISSTKLLLTMILLTAAALRLYQLDWDQGTFLHPDELHIVNTITLQIVFDWPPDLDNLLDPSSSRLNPRSQDPLTGDHHNFAYGAMPLLVTDLAANLLSQLTGTDWSAFYGHIHKVGRFLSAMSDTFTVLLVFLIGRRIFNTTAGLFAAALYATAPVPIQLSHFFTTDTWMTSFATLALYFLVRAAQTGAVKWFALGGVAFGLAMASKASVPALAGIALVAIAVDVARRIEEGEPVGYAFSAAPERFAVTVISALIAFGLFEPYALANPLIYLSQLREQAQVVRGQLDVPFTRQYVDTTPGMYQLEQLLRWGLGPVAGLLSLAGGLQLGSRALRARQPGAIVLTAWLVIQGLIILIPETKFLRYTAPLLPILAIGAGAALLTAFTFVRRRTGHFPAAAMLFAVLLGVAVWTASFMSVYASPNSRIEASQWIYANVPNGSRLTAETWDLALPIAFAPGLTANDHQLKMIPLDLYTSRAPNVVADDIYSALESADYVVMSSNRAATAVSRAPWRYPVQIRYFELLESERLGFTLVRKFQTSPGLGPIDFNDEYADESFINYDHPTVLVYEKTGYLDRATYDALMAPAENRPYSPTRYASDDSLILDEPVGDQPVVADARWSESLTGRTLPAVAVWIILLIVLQAAGFPIAARLFPRFPDLGWGFARLISLLLSGYVVWILASLELISFRAVWCAVAFGLVLTVSARLVMSGNLRARVSERKSAILGAELTFWAVFSLLLAFRFVNPDSWHPIWGGEKPMEFAHLNAILRSAHFPPIDPWYADGYINYYYYGSYLTAFLFKLTGIPSEIAFNLAQPTMIAFIASCGFSVTAAIARDLTGRRRAALGGVLGAALLVIAGNLDSAIRFARALPDGVNPTFETWTWPASRAITGGITEFPYFTGLYADLHAHVVAWSLTILAIGLCYSLTHQPRVMTVAISQSRHRGVATQSLAVRLGLLALVLGSLFATNAWDVPVYAALVAISIFMSTSSLPLLSVRIAVTVALTLATSFVAFVLFQPFLANYITLFGSLERTRTQTNVIEFATHLGVFLPIVGVGLMVLALGRGLAWRVVAYLDPVIVATVVVSLIAVDVLNLIDGAWIPTILVIATVGLLAIAAGNATSLAARDLWRNLAAIFAVVGSGSALVLAISGRETLALALGFATAGGVTWLVGDSIATRFTGALVSAAAFVVAGVEIVFLADDLAPDPIYYRMNTVFKFYNQVWTLLAIAAAVLLTTMIQRFLAAAPAVAKLGIVDQPIAIEDADAANEPTKSLTIVDEEDERLAKLVRGRWVQIGVVCSVILISASLFYPLLSTIPRLDQRFAGNPSIGTLNALDWMRYGTIPRPDGNGTIDFASDLAAIEWFNNEIEGTPVIAEASIGPYRGNGSRISIATGLPTVLGWERHERQQRYPEGIAERWRDVRTLYNSASPEVKLEILRKYDVQYVVVGDVERFSATSGEWYASSDGIAAFDGMVGNSLEIAFQSGSTTVYRVIPADQTS